MDDDSTLRRLCGFNFRAALKQAGIKQKDLAEELGVTASVINNWYGRGVPANYAHLLAPRLNVAPSDICVQLAVMASMRANKAELVEHSNVGEPAGGYLALGTVPVISWVQAGEWSEAVDNYLPGDADEWISCPVAHSEQSYALRVQGSSMEPKFTDKEIIVVDPERDPGTGSFVIAKKTDSNEVTFKQLAIDAGSYYLVALNPDWPDRYIKMSENWHICGVVICKIEVF